VEHERQPLSWSQRLQQVARFFGTVPAGGRLDHIRLVATRANRQPALAAYVPAADGADRAYGIMVLAVAEDRIQAITGFQDASLFQAFGLPQTPIGGLAPLPVSRSLERRVSAAR
jgi:RNA polymerase sigma-70 factor, ECF subfamily